jgi:peptide/nickel transport system ATP-binding protein
MTAHEVESDLSGLDTGGPLLQVENLVVDYLTPRGRVRAVDHVSFEINRGEIVGLAGESGCGKSTAAHAILGLLKPPAQITSGHIRFKGTDLVSLRSKAMRQVRWRDISMVFQSAMNSLNPVMRVGDHFVDTLQAHSHVSSAQASTRAADLLALVGIERARLRSYPHELSGGMRQRIGIALALALQPELIIMDEPTTALDVVVQREILEQIEALQARLGFAVLFITHDLSLLVEFSRRIAIMYAGEIVESGPASELFASPKHPYTRGLMASFPSLSGERTELTGIPGFPPDLISPPSGCRFHPRCAHCTQYRATVHPTLREVGPGHLVACHMYGDERAG